MRGVPLFFIALFLSFGFAPHLYASCPSPTSIQVLLSDSPMGHSLMSVEEIIFHSSPEDLDAVADASFQRLQKYQDSIRARVEDVNPISLLIRQRDIFTQFFGPQMAMRFDDVIQGRMGTIDVLRCTEGYLLEHFLGKMPNLAERPAEYGAYILESADRLVRKIYFVWGAEDAQVPHVSEVDDWIDRDHRDGFKLKAHLHNHPFVLEALSRSPEARDIAGTLIPSGDASFGDVSAYLRHQARFKLESAWITNGFNTLRLSLDHLAFIPIFGRRQSPLDLTVLACF